MHFPFNPAQIYKTKTKPQTSTEHCTFTWKNVAKSTHFNTISKINFNYNKCSFSFEPYQTYKETQRKHRHPQNIALYMFWKTLLIPFISTLFIWKNLIFNTVASFIQEMINRLSHIINGTVYSSMKNMFLQAIKQEPADLLVWKYKALLYIRKKVQPHRLF